GSSHWIQYDFAQPRRLSKTWVWNTNDPRELDRGFKDVHIDYSLDGEEWTYWGNFSFPQGSGAAVYGGFPGPDMVGIEARYVLITASSNHGDPSCFGVAEVKFNLLPNPEGSTADGTYENCQPITVAEAEIVGQTAALLSWEPVETSENYLVEYRLIGSSTWFQALDDYAEAYLEGLIPLETYEYRITSLCFSETSEPVTGTFTLNEAALCPAAEDVAIVLENVSNTEAFLYWELEEFAVNNMTITYGVLDAPADQQQNINVSDPEVFLDGLQPETTYQVVLSWTCGDQTFTLDEFTFMTRANDEGACSAVGEITLVAIDFTSASFSWEATANAESYLVAYTIEDEDEWTSIETTETSISLTGLLPEEPYLFVVSVRCGENLLSSPLFYFDTQPLVSASDPSSQRSITTYPNPTRGLVAVDYTSNRQEDLHFELVSPLGQVVQAGIWPHLGGQQQYALDLNRQIDGVYLLRLSLAGRTPLGTKKVVKIGGR
ncbi:MAG: fibronectin type III domain-containing protein, partial [Bacteroidota bacterium]